VVARPCVGFAMVQTEADSLPSPSNSRHRRPSEESDHLELIYMILSGFLDGAIGCAMDAMGCKAVARRRVGSLHQVDDGSKLPASALHSSSTSADLVTWGPWTVRTISAPQGHYCSLACSWSVHYICIAAATAAAADSLSTTFKPPAKVHGLVTFSYHLLSLALSSKNFCRACQVLLGQTQATG
jgi:hypothetical protein